MIETLEALAEAWRERSRELRPKCEGNYELDLVDEAKADVLLACAAALKTVLESAQ